MDGFSIPEGLFDSLDLAGDSKTEVKPAKPVHVPMGPDAFIALYGEYSPDPNAVRTALTNKLLELADCGDTKHELRAIELLGKHRDVGLFTERSEINVNYKDAASLEAAIKAKLGKLLEVKRDEVLALGVKLEEEQAEQPVEAEFTEVDESDDGGRD